MSIIAAPARFFGVLRRHRARPKRTLADYIALSIARALSLVLVGGLVYVTYVVEMAGFNDHLRCNRDSTMTRLEWVLGIRPAEDCRG
jgi:hypothetical protein